MSGILCSELDYRAVKLFLSGQSFFLGLSQVIGQTHNCVVTCVSVYFYISDYTGYNSCCSGGFHAVRALNQSYPHQGGGQIWNCHCCNCCIGILSEYLFWLVYCLLPSQGFCEGHPPGKPLFVLALNASCPQATLAD